jgi:glycosyltransferase involved in cell wall biosynthesis
MKIAIFHDYFDEIGGAELTILILAKELKATIITTNIDREKISQLGYSNLRFISIGKIPTIKHLKQFSAKWKFSHCDFSKEFDFFIFGNFCSIFAAPKHPDNLWYCISPERGLYDLRHFRKGLLRPVKEYLKKYLIQLDQAQVKKIEKIAVISRNIQERILKYYQRNSIIIYPPVNTNNFIYKPHQGYWLSIARIDPYKRIELQLKAFSKLPNEKLVIVGGSSKEFENYFEKLKEKSPKNVVFMGPVFKRQKMINLAANCIGLITTSINEDFGLNAIGAMASGKPVIAPNEGGYKETIIDGVTGKLIDDIDEDKLVRAIEEIGKNPEKYKDACIKQAKRFDVRIFIEKVKKVHG